MVEDNKILSAYVYLVNHVPVQTMLAKVTTANQQKTVQAMSKHLQNIKMMVVDVGTSFNAAEQIQSLHGAQKEIDMLESDALSLKEENILTDLEYQQLVRYARELDEAVRAMSDPEFS